jgi:hypothetical protein
MTCLENFEVYKYRGLYTHPQHAARYGHTCHGSNALPIIDEWKPVSLLDIGCGWNEFAAKVRTLANPPLNVIGTDFACPGADLIADATSLTF